MGKKAVRSTTPIETTIAATQSTTPIKTTIAGTQPFTPTKTAVEPQEQEQEDVSVEATVETRGTGSVVSDDRRIQDSLAAMGPPPPPPPVMIRAVSHVTPKTPVETRDEDAVLKAKNNNKTREIVPESKIEERDREAVAEETKQDPQQLVTEEVAKDDLTLEDASDDEVSESPADSEESEAQKVEPQVEALKTEHELQDSTPAVEEEPVVEPTHASVEESPKETLDLELEPAPEAFSPVVNHQSVEAKQGKTPPPQVQQEETNESQSGYFSFEQVAQKKSYEESEVEVAEKSFPENFANTTRSLSIVEETSEESQHSKEEILQIEVDEIKLLLVQKAEPPSSSEQQTKQKKRKKKIEPNAHRTPKPAFLEAETILDVMLVAPTAREQPVGKAMLDMAVSAQPVTHHHHQYAASQTLQPVDELQERVAAIPESKDDVPAPHVHEHYPLSYDGDDVSVLTEFVCPKSLSPRNMYHQSLAWEPIAEESSSLEEARESGSVQKTNFVEAATPRLSNTAASVPRREPVECRDPMERNPVRRERVQMESEQLELGEYDPRQPLQKDPPQFSSHRIHQEAGRGIEPAEVTSQPLVKHLRGSSASSPGQHSRQGRRLRMSVTPADPYGPRQMEAPQAISPLSVSGQNSVHHFPQSRAAPMGYVPSPYGSAGHPPIVSNVPQMQHRYITTRSGAASVASYHQNQYGDAHTVMSQQPMGYYGPPPARFSSGGSVASMPYQRTRYHPSSRSNVGFHEQHFFPNGSASVAPSIGGETIISVRTNARGNKVVKKLVKVEEEEETDAVVACFECLDIDKLCGIEFDEQYKVVEEELPPEPLTAANVARNTAMGKKVFNENNYTDPFAGRNDEASFCGLL